MIPPLLRKGDYIYGSFVKPELTNGFINDGNPGNRDDHIGRFPFSLTNANEAIAYAAAVHEQWKNLPFRKRIEPAKEFRNQLERRTKYIAHIMTRENRASYMGGSPRAEKNHVPVGHPSHRSSTSFSSS